LLRSINGTLVPQNFVDPQYAVPEGAYLLEIQDLPTQYFVPKLPVKVLAGINWGYRKTILEINALNTTELNPWKFAIIAELDPLFSFASFSDLTNNMSSKTLSLNVTTKAKMYDWWGCFVLPGTATVTAARAYNGTVWHNLTELYDYTINPVANYTLCVPRIQPETERLELSYTTAPPA
jgi:hypothetical protein